MFTIKDAEDALRKLAAIKGRERARIVEQIFRWETGHFKSKQYQLCGSPGMEDGDWKDLDESVMKKIQMKDNHPEKVKIVMRTFLVWNDVFDFCMYLSDYIDRYNGKWERWNSTNPNQQLKYKKCVESIWPKTIK